MSADLAQLHAGARPGRLLRVGGSLTLDYLLTHFGYFALLPLLPILLTDGLAGVGPAGVGAGLFALILSMRLSSLLISGWLERYSAKRCMVVALILPAAAFGTLWLAHGLLVVFGLLVMAGLGISVNGLLARATVAAEFSDRSRRLTVFAAINVAVNAAASLGPLLGALLYHSGAAQRLLLPVAACYLAAAVMLLVTLPSSSPKDHAGQALVDRLLTVAHLLRSPAVRRLAITSVLGWFLYAQLFSALPLFLVDVVHNRQLAATYFTANAVLVVALQAPLAVLAASLLRSRTTPTGLMTVGCLLFAGSFAMLGIFGWSAALDYVAITLFSIGEVLFTPLVDAAFAEVETPSALERYNVRQVVTAAGESGGSFVGASAYLILRTAGGPLVYWLLLAGAAAMVLAALTLIPTRAGRADGCLTVSQR